MMSMSENIGNNLDGKLRNYSQVISFNRLTDRDSQILSSLQAGGDEEYILNDNAAENPTNKEVERNAKR
jgi:hypothetical protein